MCHYRVINVIQTPGPETLCLVIKGSCFRQIITNWSLCFVASGQSVNTVCELSIALVSTTQTIQTTQWMTQAHLMPVAVSEQLQMNEREQNRNERERTVKSMLAGNKSRLKYFLCLVVKYFLWWPVVAFLWPARGQLSSQHGHNPSKLKYFQSANNWSGGEKAAA